VQPGRGFRRRQSSFIDGGSMESDALTASEVSVGGVKHF